MYGAESCLWHTRQKNEFMSLLADAVDMGYTFFDTAEVYGTPDNPHLNEEMMGRP